MSERVILILLAAAVMALLLLPLRRRRTGASPPPHGVAAPPAEVADDDPAALALREIELDRLMGKLSEADYLALKAKYEAARQARPARPARPEPSPLDDLATPASAASRDGTGEAFTEASLEQRAEALVRRWRQESLRCPECGDRPEPDARYCSNCGRVLVPCPGCGSRVDEPAARHCSRCGATLAA